MLHRGPSVQVVSCIWPAPGLLQDVLLTPASGDLAKASCVQDLPETPAGAKPRPGQNTEPCPVWPMLSWAPAGLCGLQLTEGKKTSSLWIFPCKRPAQLAGHAAGFAASGSLPPPLRHNTRLQHSCFTHLRASKCLSVPLSLPTLGDLANVRSCFFSLSCPLDTLQHPAYPQWGVVWKSKGGRAILSLVEVAVSKSALQSARHFTHGGRSAQLL